MGTVGPRRAAWALLHSANVGQAKRDELYCESTLTMPWNVGNGLPFCGTTTSATALTSCSILRCQVTAGATAVPLATMNSSRPGVA
jgi:hypothetical protein